MKRLSTLSLPLVSSLILPACGLSSAERDQLAAACEGQPVAGAGAYEGSAKGFAPFRKDSSSDAYTYDVDGVHYKLAGPATLAEAHTVFCMEPAEEVPEGACQFEQVDGIGVAGVQVIDVTRSDGPTFPRVSVQRKARIVDPSTGETVAEHTLKKDAPKCDAFVGDPTESAFRAKPPRGISFADWATGQLGVSK